MLLIQLSMRKILFNAFLFSGITSLLAPLNAFASEKSFATTCNLRYNNRGIIYNAVPCRATFSGKKVRSIALVFPSNGQKYDWRVGAGSITADPRWAECIRHTSAIGNQWQICTVPSPPEFGL